MTLGIVNRLLEINSIIIHYWELVPLDLAFSQRKLLRVSMNVIQDLTQWYH